MAVNNFNNVTPHQFNPPEYYPSVGSDADSKAMSLGRPPQSPESAKASDAAPEPGKAYQADTIAALKKSLTSAARAPGKGRAEEKMKKRKAERQRTGLKQMKDLIFMRTYQSAAGKSMEKEDGRKTEHATQEIGTALQKMQAILDGDSPSSIKKPHQQFQLADAVADFHARKREIDEHAQEERQPTGSLTAGQVSDVPRSRLARTGQQFLQTGRNDKRR